MEVWLTSEDLGAYGHDIGVTLPELLWQLVGVVPDSCMLRLGMTNPPYIMEHMEVSLVKWHTEIYRAVPPLQAMAAILSHPRVYSFLHIPVQSGSDQVLGAMRREYTAAEFRHLVDYLKAKCGSTESNLAAFILCSLECLVSTLRQTSSADFLQKLKR